jgi:hypothetical protein
MKSEKAEAIVRVTRTPVEICGIRPPVVLLHYLQS